MLISEQKHTNKNRIYYRGLRNNDLNNKQYLETYLTTSLTYSFAYSGLNGVIESYCLKDTANIFNMRSKLDEGKLRVYCNNTKINSLSLADYLKFNEISERLKNEDWLKVLEDLNKRKLLIKAIKELGYDGYFNFEITRDMINEYRQFPSFEFSDLHIKSPAVAVFNINKSLIKIATYSGRELNSLAEIQKLKEKEKQYVISTINNYKERNNDNIFIILRNKIKSLTDDELKEIIKTANTPENRSKQKERAELYLEAIKERIKERS